MGEKAAYACTVAVEEVIEDHYEEQLKNLDENEAELKEKILKFKADETEHKETSLANQAEQAVGYELLTTAIKAGSKAAIWLAKRL
jgi:ubiquinone biosynthesis monooxygenase Coq7